jgi:hypothetical protein
MEMEVDIAAKHPDSGNCHSVFNHKFPPVECSNKHSPNNCRSSRNTVPCIHVAEVLSNAHNLTSRGENRVTSISSAACRTLGLIWDESLRPLFGRMEARSSHANAFFQPGNTP